MTIRALPTSLLDLAQFPAGEHRDKAAEADWDLWSGRADAVGTTEARRTEFHHHLVWLLAHRHAA